MIMAETVNRIVTFHANGLPALPGRARRPGRPQLARFPPQVRSYEGDRSACSVRHAWVATCRLNCTSGRPIS
jgi:hypothetical protein